MLQTAFRPCYISRASVFWWDKRFTEGRESVRDNERCGRSKEVNTPELMGQRVRVRVSVTMLRFLREFRKRFGRMRLALFKSGQWHFHQDNSPVHTILVTDYLTKMGITTVPHPPYSPDLTSCDFCLIPTLTGCRYEAIEGDERGCDEGHWHAHKWELLWGLPEVVGTVEQVHCSWRSLFRSEQESHVYTINKSAHTKKSGNLFND